jgi:hypothetical protein
LTLERLGDADTHKSVHLHLNYGLFAEILRDVAASIAKMPADDMAHRESLAEAVALLHQVLSAERRT